MQEKLETSPTEVSASKCEMGILLNLMQGIEVWMALSVRFIN